MAENIPHQALISIITVVFNSEKYIEKTIQSILNQTYKNIEYIIVDGASTDSTLAIASKYKNKIATLISESDCGLYDAMNKGIKLSKGDFLMFINSGDMLYDDSTIEKIFAHHTPKNLIYYGDTMIIDENEHEIGLRRLRPLPATSWQDLINGMLICHQSIVVHRSIATFFDVKFRYSADYKWVLEAMKAANGAAKNTQQILSRFLDGGQTKKTLVSGLRERFRIMVMYFGWRKTVRQHFFIALTFFAYLIRYKRF